MVNVYVVEGRCDMGFFVKMDEVFLQDEKIRRLIKEKGYEGVGVYFSLLSLIRKYRESSYKIPFKSISDIADWDLKIPEEKLRDYVDLFTLIGLFKRDSEYFWSERRRNELLNSDELRKKFSEAGKKGMKNRYEKS